MGSKGSTSLTWRFWALVTEVDQSAPLIPEGKDACSAGVHASKCALGSRRSRYPRLPRCISPLHRHPRHTLAIFINPLHRHQCHVRSRYDKRAQTTMLQRREISQYRPERGSTSKTPRTRRIKGRLSLLDRQRHVMVARSATRRQLKEHLARKRFPRINRRVAAHRQRRLAKHATGEERQKLDVAVCVYLTRLA